MTKPIRGFRAENPSAVGYLYVVNGTTFVPIISAQNILVYIRWNDGGWGEGPYGG